jgi:hypothetical protein
MFNKKSTLLLLTVLVLVLAACGGSSEPAATDDGGAASGGDAALKITGMVDNEMAWTEAEVRAKDTMDAVSTNNDGEEKTYTGVSLNALLDEAGVQDGATTVALVADDGYEAEVTLEEMRGCADCIASFRDQGGFSAVMPGFSGKLQVKGIVEIKVK